MLAEPRTSAASSGWHASLALEFAPACGRTGVARRQHVGPLCIQKPFHAADGSCHVYVLHPPGGLVGGDDVMLDAVARERSSALITMPASTKFYRSQSLPSRLRTRLVVEPGATLEWLPTESILFGGSRASMATEIHLSAGSRFVGWETIALGRPRSGDHFATGRFEQRLDVWLGSAPLLFERMQATAGDPMLTADWGLGGHTLSATWLAYPGDRALLDQLRTALAGAPDVRFGASSVDGLLVLRVLGRKLEPVRALLEAARCAVAPALLGRPALAPRIWKT